jgi:hypothetical protein
MLEKVIVKINKKLVGNKEGTTASRAYSQHFIFFIT